MPIEFVERRLRLLSASLVFCMAVLVGMSLTLPAQAQRLSNDAPVTAQLANHGHTAMNITLGTDASKDPELAQLAKWLAATLHTMTDAEFQVKVSDTPDGIAIGLPVDFASLKLADRFDSAQITRREEYILRSHSNGVYVIGATSLAVQDAVADLLHRLGYRRFFPGNNWEIIPHTPALSVAVDVFETPDYLSRRIWYGFGTWPEVKDQQALWQLANRNHHGVKLSTGHAYDAIISRNKKAFERRPHTLPAGRWCTSW